MLQYQRSRNQRAGVMAAIKYLTLQDLSQTKFLDPVRGRKLLRLGANIKVHKKADKREDEDRRHKDERDCSIKLQLVLFEEEKEGHQLR